jgi:hypothetical protein
MNWNQFSPEDQASILKAVTQSTGFTVPNAPYAIQLDEGVKLAFSTLHPVLSLIPKGTAEMAGQKWGGNAFQFKSITNPNASGLPFAVSPGNRNAIAEINTTFSSAPYGSFGYDQEVDFESQDYTIGLDDALNLARMTTVSNVFNNYDLFTIAGNRGTSSNGFKLGTANNAAADGTTSTGGSLGSSSTVYCFVVELTAMGLANNPASTTATSVVSTVTRTPANPGAGSETVPVGVGIVSAASGSQETGGSTSTNTVSFTVTPKNGAFGWAWYVGTSNSKASCYLSQITDVPVVTISAIPANTNQAANASSLTSDNSYNGVDTSNGSNSPAPEFDGAFAYLVNSLSNGNNLPAQYENLLGAGLTPTGTGTVLEIDNLIYDQFIAYQSTPDALICGIAMADTITAAVQSGASNLRFNVDADADGNIRGGQMVKEYRLKFSNVSGGQKIIPVIVSTHMPPNAIWLPTLGNPFPSTSNSIPQTLKLIEMRPMYSMNYAFTGRSYQLGTYVTSTLANHAPQLGILIAGAGAYLNA